jgi:hypothetical protein
MTLWKVGIKMNDYASLMSYTINGLETERHEWAKLLVSELLKATHESESNNVKEIYEWEKILNVGNSDFPNAYETWLNDYCSDILYDYIEWENTINGKVFIAKIKGEN